ncbi:hypothetical protein [Bacillus xiapuensis]|uniref:hypothetical protein n=1 Tax=Bacillus xiapuensis TaxID=2014075 RepID=UPI000C24A574|nr:hypothetical protein [Bacillus xiapuensis]
MGYIANAAKKQLEGYKTEQIKGKKPADFAGNVDQAYAEVSESYPESIINVSSEEKHKRYSIPAVNWIAHMPELILYVSNSGIPKETLKKRQSE